MRKILPILAILALISGLIISPKVTTAQTTIRVLTFFAYDNPEVERGIVAAFEAAHPAIDVQLELTKYDDIYIKFNADLAAGNPPDVVSVNFENLRQYAGWKVLEPVDDYVKRDNYDLSIYYENTRTMHTVNGYLYGLPATFSDNVLYYNRTLFDDAKIPYPDNTWDWAKLIEVAKKFVKSTKNDGIIDQYGYGPAWWPMYLFLFNTNVLTPDNSKCALTTPDGLQAIQAYVDLSLKDKVTADKDAQASQGDYDRFVAGKLAMYDAGTWAVRPFKENIKGFTFDIAENPKGTVKGTFLYSNAYAITAASKSKDAAWEFLKFATGVAGSTVRQKGQFEISTVKSVADSVFVSSMKDSLDHPEVFMSSISFGQKLSEHPRFSEIIDAIQPEMDVALTGAESVADTMTAACKAVDAIIQRK